MLSLLLLLLPVGPACGLVVEDDDGLLGLFGVWLEGREEEEE
jgi:hypothetical protein